MGELARRRRVEITLRNMQSDAAQHTLDEAEADVVGINRVAARGIVTGMNLQALSDHAEQLAPGGADLYAMYTAAATAATMNVIADLPRRLQQCRRPTS